jgi:sec-independent protein translocase protein TatB
MFGIGMPELLVILVVALVVLGPNRLPELAKTLGKAMAEFRRQSSDIMDEFQTQMQVEENTARRANAKPATANPTPPTPNPTPTSSDTGGTPPPSSPA